MSAWSNVGARFARVLVYPTIYEFGRPLYIRHFRAPTALSDLLPAPGQENLDLLTPAALSATDAAARYATLKAVGEAGWSDYRVTAQIRATAADGEIGLLIRYANPENHYRFVLSSSPGYLRLVRAQNGSLTTLWESRAAADQVHRKQGRNVLAFAAQGRQRWQARFEHWIPRYTTRWDELLKVRAA